MLKNREVHHEHDVGYKHIFSHKATFLEFLRSFTKKEWANLIKEEDLIFIMYPVRWTIQEEGIA
ncbi:MAG: hypothetical protein Q607_CBUC00180G0002 [Clostridium butyricum DORA_1]|nr:MAG: hypothetical protein Q607_CBUC00180G0002 [Clostridium butyricum DORA_1]